MAFSTTPSVGNDRLRATADNQTINALAGNDWITSTFDASTLYGGLGRDRISVALDMLAPTREDWERTSTVYGGNGNDRISSSFRIYSAEYAGGAITSLQNGGRGDDEIYISASSMPREGSSVGIFSFGINGDSGSDDIWIDISDADASIQNYVSGGTGHDRIYIYSSVTQPASRTVHHIDGGAGNDEIVILAGPDNSLEDSFHYIYGGGGNDRIEVSVVTPEGEIEVDGGSGDDTITLTVTDTAGILGSGISTGIAGGSGDDIIRLIGPVGASIIGGTGDDTIAGGSGSDHITGGAGADMLRGGAGDDAFYFQWMAGGTPDIRDTILDFGSGGWRGDDLIGLFAIDADATVAGNQAFTFGGTTQKGIGFLWVEENPDTAGSLVMANNGGAELLVIAVTDGDGRNASDWRADDFVL